MPRVLLAVPDIVPPIQRDPLTYTVIGAAMAVHRELGPGFAEAVYQEALALELAELALPFAREVKLPIRYKGRILRKGFRADFVIGERLILEIKALREVGGVEEAQILNYLKAGGRSTGLLLNFGGPRLTYRRFIWTTDSADKRR